MITEFLGGVARVIIGWPGVMTSLIASIYGIWCRKPIFLIIGAVFIFPLAWYLSNTPKFGNIAWLLPLLHLCSAYAVAKSNKQLAGFLLLPFVILIFWLGAITA